MSVRTGLSIGGMVVGGVLGGIFAAPTGGMSILAGISLGASLGGLAGGLAGTLYDTMTAPDSVSEQPSLADLAIQTSSFGQVIPQIFGTMGNIAGNVIWAGDKIEHQQREEHSAKGGGPKQVTITKTYSMSFALGLCDTRITGPIVGVNKIYRDLKLIYDRSLTGSGALSDVGIHAAGSGYAVNDVGGVAGGDLNAGYRVEAVNGSGGITALTLTTHGSGYAVADAVALHRGSGSGNNASIDITAVVGNVFPAGWTFYSGTADQAPDPVLEAALGVGQVPGYHSLCYLVIEDDDLGRSGRTYNYTFELSQDPQALPDVVTTLCGAAGLDEDEIDVSELPFPPVYDDVNLALVTMQEVRAPLQQLAQAFRFYVVESGTTLKFRQLGSGEVIATLPEDDLDATEEASAGKGLQITRHDEFDLPTELNVTYTDPQQNYLSNTQRALLAAPTGALDAPRTVSVALALTAAQAKRLAQENLNELWIQRETLQTTVGRQYAYLEPGDRVVVTSRGITYEAVVTQTTYGRPGLVELTARLDASFVVNAAVAEPGLVLPPEDPVWSLTDTIAILLNLPALTAADQDPRFHVAYLGTSDLWPGAALYRSTDGEASYQFLDAGLLQAVTGTVADAIPDADWHVLDDDTVATVVMGAGELSSVSDLALFNGSNLAMLGDEVLGFGVATLVDTATYELSHLLRGRRGTEWSTGLHAANERFTLLDAGVRAIAMNVADRYVSRPYKAPTLGQSLADVEQSPFTPTAENVVPWTNAQEGATRPVSDWVLTWRYRSTFAGDWVDYNGVGYDPGFTGFVVTVYTDATFTTVQRTITTDGGSPLTAEATLTETYTLGQQTTDFGGVQSTLYWSVASLTTYGAGRVNQITSTP